MHKKNMIFTFIINYQLLIISYNYNLFIIIIII